MASNIGIKIANGEFYPILEENSLIKKRLILSTVHDNQSSVQIDLYRSLADTMTDAQYIGSIVVENISPKPKGEPSIELIVSSKKNGDIVADAIELGSGPGAEHYVLTVSLKSLDETSRDLEIPDFELESNEGPPSGLYQRANKKLHEKSRRSFPLFPIMIVLLILGLLALWLFLFGGMEKVKPLITKSDTVSVQQPAKEPETAKQTEPAVEPIVKPPEPAIEPVVVEPAPVTPVIKPVVTPPAARVQTGKRRAPVFSYNVPAVIPREGVNYVVRWGDTLWDISEAFYRDPWLYRRIANQNNIRNPNHIISGRTIRIPPKN